MWVSHGISVKLFYVSGEMINLFRKIRKHSIVKNSFAKYLAYAIGEILLILIGILLALQINTWNQAKKDRVEEIKNLSALHEEFKHKKANLQSLIVHFTEMVEASELLMDLIGKDPVYLKTINTDKIIAKAIVFNEYLPSEHTLSELISTGKLNLLSSSKLKTLLFKWSQQTKLNSNDYSMIFKYFMESFIPYLNKNASMKNIDRYTHLAWKNPTVLTNDYQLIFQQIEFENHIDNYLWTLSTYLDALIRLELLVDQILIETKR